MKEKLKLIDANIENLTSLWKTVSMPFGSYYKNQTFDYCQINDSDWPNRLWFNQEINKRIVEQAIEKLSAIDGTMIVPYWNMYDNNLLENLETAGFTKKFQQIGMSLKLDQPVKLEPNLIIKLVSNDADAKEWAEIYLKAFKYKISEETLVNTFKDINYYLAYYQNEPVGTAILFQTNKVSGIHGVGVIPEMRKRGFAEQIMKHLINMAVENNSEYVTLQASDMGKNIYLQLGFEEQFVIKNYFLQP